MTKIALSLALLLPFHGLYAVEFDRPKLAFAASTLSEGQIAWEQGLPRAVYYNHHDIHFTQLTLESVIRIGVAESFEVQLGLEPHGWQKLRTAGQTSYDDGLGDGSLGVKWAPQLNGPVSLAVLADTRLAYGDTPAKDHGNNTQLGTTLNWALSDGRSAGFYINRLLDGDSGRGWLFSPSFTFPLNDAWSAYLEAGIGTKALHSRSAGAGITYAINSQLQLDTWFLAGFDDDTANWQGGFGFAWLIGN